MLRVRLFAMLLLLVPLMLAAGCRQGLGQRCQVDSDCIGGTGAAPTVQCVIPAGSNLSEGGTCQLISTSDGGTGDAGSDAATDLTPPPDLTPQPDLTAPPDLTPPPDLTAAD